MSDQGGYTVRVTNLGGATTSAPPATLTVEAPPVITCQPQALSACAGENVSLVVCADGASSLSYQWRKEDQPVPWGTNAVLTFTNVQPADAGNYDVVVTGHCGSVTSHVATVTAGVGPAIACEPQSQTNCAGANVSLVVCATGTSPLSYQWRKGGQPVPRGTNDILTFTNVHPADAGNYDAVVTNQCGSVTSHVATVSVEGALRITCEPQSQTNCAGANLSLVVCATGTSPLSYQWRKGGQPVARETSDILTFTNVQPADADNYDAVVTSQCGSVTSRVARLEVDVSPSITAQPGGQSVCAGAQVTFCVSATGSAPLSYQWRFNDAPISGATSNCLLLTNVQAANAGQYSVVVINVCDAVTSLAAVLTVTNVCGCPTNELLATHATGGNRYVSPGTNTIVCQITNKTGLSLLSLLWEPVLPPDWVVLSASGDGGPSVGPDGKIVFLSFALTNNPLNFTYSVSIPTGVTGDQAIRGNVEYHLTGRADIDVTCALPNPLWLRRCGYHDADCSEDWSIDSTEVNRVLAYWRALAYHCDPTTCDALAPGQGPTNCAPHVADCDTTFWRFSASEVARVLVYWRAGSYHCDPGSTWCDGYSPGAAPPTLVAPLLLPREGMTDARAVHQTSDLYASDGLIRVTNTFTYSGGLWSLLWRPRVPDGWTVQSVSGDGNPELVLGEILWTGFDLPPSPVRMVYTVQAPPGERSRCEIAAQVEYFPLGARSASTNCASPDPLASGTVKFTRIVPLPENRVRLDLTGTVANPVAIRSACDVTSTNWTAIATLQPAVPNWTISITNAISCSNQFFKAGPPPP
jgi:hypothetical protein